MTDAALHDLRNPLVLNLHMNENNQHPVGSPNPQSAQSFAPYRTRRSICNQMTCSRYVSLVVGVGGYIVSAYLHIFKAVLLPNAP